MEDFVVFFGFLSLFRPNTMRVKRESFSREEEERKKEKEEKKEERNRRRKRRRKHG